MTHQFDPKEQLIVVKARIVGPTGDTMVRMALDIRASSTVIGWNAHKVVGYSTAHASCHVEMTTGSATELVPKIKLRQIHALGKRRRGLEVVAHTLPLTASVDGLLGLDFFRKLRLTIDFRKYMMTLA